jgi:predicted nucleotidyltransferase
MRDKVLQFAKEVSYLLREEIKENLVSIAPYGSSVRGNLRDGGDIDILVVLEKADTSYHKGMKPFTELLDRMETLMAQLDKLRFYLFPSFLVLIKEEIERHPPLLIEIAHEGIILYDKDDLLKNELKKIKNRLSLIGNLEKEPSWGPLLGIEARS